MPAAPKTTYLKDYQPAPFSIEHAFLHIDLYDDYAAVTAVLKITRNPASKQQDAPLVLDGEEMELTKVMVNGELLSAEQYQQDKQHLTIAAVPDKFTLETEVLIKPQLNTKLSGLYQSGGNFCTQCEAQGFRRITYFLDRPDVLTLFDTAISADKTRYPMLLSNGNLMETRELANNRHWVHWQDPSFKPCYLFALVAGDFDLLQDEFVTMSGRKIQLDLYLEKGYLDQGSHALNALKKAMKWDEQRWGREYDLDIYMIVAVSDFNMGAMENKGLNIFNTKYILAKPETATDQDYVGIETVIGHEYFHNWSGNRVTCRDWFQITLKEGLTVFRDQSFTEDVTSAAVARLNEVNFLRNAQFAEDASQMAHPIRPDAYIEINNFYTHTVYRKGAEVIRMVQTLLTPEVFRQGLDLYFERHDGQAVTTEDFIQAMADASGRDLSQFQRWYSQAGTPVLDINGEYDATAKTFTLQVAQSCPPTPGQPDKLPLHIPLAVGLINASGDDLPLQLTDERAAAHCTRVLEVTEPHQTFTFKNVEQAPIPSLLRHFSAPVRLHYPYTEAELATLWQHDNDGLARWEASQSLMTRVLIRLAEAHQAGQALELDNNIQDSVNFIINDNVTDLELRSHLMVLPTERYVLQVARGMDIDAIAAARQFVKQQLGLQLEAALLAGYQQYQSTADYEYQQQALGERAIKNRYLDYLVATQKAEYRELAQQQFNHANNMTDRMGALAALNQLDSPERDQALADFYELFKQEPLVVNKWLLLQASAPLANTLEQVKALLKHQAYDRLNPNNVYALVVGFGANKPSFHAADGSGYEFIKAQTLELNGDNPQVAARVIQPLIQWQLVDSKRQALMREALQEILAHEGLSPDIYELVSKSV